MRSIFIILLLFSSMTFGEENAGLSTEYKIVEGTYRITNEWSIQLNQPYNAKVEGETLIIWRPELSIWVVVWNNDNQETIEERASWLRDAIPKNAFEIEQSNSNGVTKINFRIDDQMPEGTKYNYFGLAINSNSHVQILISSFSEEGLELARSLFESLKKDTP